MGLFCQMLHVFESDQGAVEKALVAVLSKHGFSLNEVRQIDGTNIGTQVDATSAPAYIVGPKLGSWIPVIDLHSEPWPGELCNELSRVCSSPVLLIMVHDDDVMFYNLDRNGDPQDGYNSNPQYFENEKVPESEIESQRHTPQPFSNLLPAGKSIDGLCNILNAGWWQAHDNSRLDDDGVISDEDWDACPYQDEGERMTALGAFLDLAGGLDYPFTYWRENDKINWQDYRLHQFGKRV